MRLNRSAAANIAVILSLQNIPTLYFAVQSAKTNLMFIRTETKNSSLPHTNGRKLIISKKFKVVKIDKVVIV